MDPINHTRHFHQCHVILAVAGDLGSRIIAVLQLRPFTFRGKGSRVPLPQGDASWHTPSSPVLFTFHAPPNCVNLLDIGLDVPGPGSVSHSAGELPKEIIG